MYRILGRFFDLYLQQDWRPVMHHERRLHRTRRELLPLTGAPRTSAGGDDAPPPAVTVSKRLRRTRDMTTRSDAPLTARRYFSAVEAAGTVPFMASPALGEGRVTRARYWQLVRDGTIGPDDRVELLDGVIVAMSPQSPSHAGVVRKLTQWLAAAVGTRGSLQVQLPLDLGDTTVPEPDVALVSGRPEDYMTAHPTTALLVVEVADSSLLQDRLTKAPLYAAAGVPEYWLVNLRDPCVEVYRQPLAHERRYAETRLLRPGDGLAPLAWPGVAIAVEEILPPR